jgi:Glycosyltransferase 61
MPSRAVPIQRLALPLPHARIVATFDEIAGAKTIDVELPRDPAPAPTSRTVQPEPHPVFAREYREPDYPLRVAVVPQGRLVTPSGLVVSDAGEVVAESAWGTEHLRLEFGRPRLLHPATRILGRHASLVSLWSDGFFHWMFNSLPKLAVLQASGVAYDSLIVPESIQPFHRETLALLGIDESMLTPFRGQHMIVDELVWPAPLSPINWPTSFLLDWLKQGLGASAQGVQPTRSLYVSRRGGTRKARNEADVFEALRPFDFEFVLPEDLSFAEQVRLFASAKVMVGPHGSNFVNGIFSEHLSVLECFQPAHVNWGVYGVLCAAGHDHWHLICPPIRGRRWRPPRFDDMIVPVDDVLRTTELMLG